MQSKGEEIGNEGTLASDEDEDDQQENLMFSEQDKTLNVFDEKYKCYLDMSPEELGLTSEVEFNLARHPLDADYLKIT